jgi:hypothetical protein
MDAPLRTPAARFVLTLLVLVLASPAAAQPHPESFEEPGYVDPSVAVALDRARLAALKKLARPRCHRLFAEFTNLERRSLEDVLAEQGETAEGHLRHMVFLDGSRISPCGMRDVYAFTNPGSLAVRLCANFRKLAFVNVASVANILIHEMLHSLGAGEAPTPGFPTAYEITSRVESRCGT